MKRSDPIAALVFYGLPLAPATLISAFKSSAADAPAPRRIGPGRGQARQAAKRHRTGTRLGAQIGSVFRLRGLLPLVAVAWLSACSGTYESPVRPVAAPPPPDVATDEARLYFYRPNDSLFPAIRPEIIINGRKVGVSVVGEAFYRDAQPGRYEIFLSNDDEELLTITLVPGQTHYVRTSIAMSWLGPHLAPTAVDPSQGAREVQALVLVEPRLEE